MGIRINDQRWTLSINNAHIFGGFGGFTNASIVVLGLANAPGHMYTIVGDADAAFVMVREMLPNLWGSWH